MDFLSNINNQIYVDPIKLSSKQTICLEKNEGTCGRPRALLKDQPIAILFRQVATPNYETAWFVRKAQRYGFRPVVVEHRNDRFSVHNSYKRSLVTPRIIMGRNKHGRAIIRQLKLVEHNAAEGQPLGSLLTVTGENLLTYHHRKLYSIMGSQAPVVVELSDIISSASHGPSAYYIDVFKLTTGRAVLFEDFVVDAATKSFFTKIVQPAYEFTINSTGDRPKVVKLTKGRWAESPLWNAYPMAMIDTMPRSRRQKDVPTCVQ